MNYVARVLFPERAELYDSGKCTDCRATIKIEEFRDEKSTREYHISGLCQKCQDKIFK